VVCPVGAFSCALSFFPRLVPQHQQAGDRVVELGRGDIGERLGTSGQDVGHPGAGETVGLLLEHDGRLVAQADATAIVDDA